MAQPGRKRGPANLTSEQRGLLAEWVAEGLTYKGVQARMEVYNRKGIDRQGRPLPGFVPFPLLTPQAITYWRKKLAHIISLETSQREERIAEGVRRGLRNKDYRVEKLIEAAEMLEPYLAQQNARGEFAASTRYSELLEQIRLEQEGPLNQSRKGALDQQGLLSLSPEQLRFLSPDVMRALAQAAEIAPPLPVIQQMP